MLQFQHFVQEKYLAQWSSSGGRLFVFDAVTRKLLRRRSHTNSCGDYNWQSPEFEKAFNKIEKAIGQITGLAKEVSGDEARLLTGWIALHFIRTSRNRDVGNLNEDYADEVEQFACLLRKWGGFFDTFQDRCLMTSDNPVCIIPCQDENGPLDVVVVPLSPKKVIYITPNNRPPKMKDGADLFFTPAKLNQLIVGFASKEIVSFNNKIHLPD